MALCGPCLELFKGKGFVKRICNVKHEFFKIFPLPEGSEDLAVKIVGGRVIPREEWVRDLRERYAGESEEGMKVGVENGVEGRKVKRGKKGNKI